METEFEATFPNINKDEIRAKLKEAGAQLIRPEFLQKRYAMNLPKGHEIDGGWVRVRDEGDRITLSLKIIPTGGGKIEEQKEIQIEVSNFEETKKLLTILGCEDKAYQETKRELWELDDVEIMIDEWPFLEPLVEIEGKSEEKVKEISEKLGFDWNDAKFCAVGALYEEKYGVPEDEINISPKIVFDMDNPFKK